MSPSLTLDTVPQEVLEQIAYFAGTDSFLGPPASLAPLLRSNRRLNTCLSIKTNQHLYFRIFAYKFDTRIPLTRLGDEKVTAGCAAELKHRCIVLKRLRERVDASIRARHADAQDGSQMTIFDVLGTAYILMLENESKNKAQLAEYGCMKEWIREFWFDQRGASLAVYNIRLGKWPLNRPETSLAMWMFWFFLSDDDYADSKDNSVESPSHVLKVLALGAHLYNLTATSWTDFEPKATTEFGETITAYSEELFIVPPPLSTPAILSYFSLGERRRTIPRAPSDNPVPKSQIAEWELEWGRSLGSSRKCSISEIFRPGSIEGVWEGFFTYIDFATYGALLSGAPPATLKSCVVGKHSQAWKLREHHLLSPDLSASDSGIEMNVDQLKPLEGGDPLRSYFPTGTQIREHRDGLLVQRSDRGQVFRYQRASLETQTACEERLDRRVLDIIITGEGHSAWGQFNLVGRVRPSDGFVSLSKDYVNGDRGKWLYRGYLVGNQNANLAGRWRDTLSPTDGPGYEGCFVMTRRR